MTVTLYELCGRDPEIRFSPYVWRSRMALVHKGLDYTAVPWRFTEKEEIAFSGQELVPVLVDGETIVSDSWTIAEYLERAYPDRPPLFGGPESLAVTRFVNAWCNLLFPRVAPFAILPVFHLLDAADQSYFRSSRETRIGRPLEEILGDRQVRQKALATALDPLRGMLADHPFIGGTTPLYADYLPFGILQWVHVVTGALPIPDDDPVFDWFQRMLDAHGGHARAARTATPMP